MLAKLTQMSVNNSHVGTTGAWRPSDDSRAGCVNGLS
jgi:hypothetical protein